MNKQIPLYLLGIGILFLFSGILCLICGVEQSNIFVIEIMYLGLGLAVVAFFLEFIIGLVNFKYHIVLRKQWKQK